MRRRSRALDNSGSMDEEIDELRDNLTSFVNLLTSAYSRQEVAVTLFAVLELIKRQEVQARQTRMFGEIVISPIHHSTAPTSTP